MAAVADPAARGATEAPAKDRDLNAVKHDRTIGTKAVAKGKSDRVGALAHEQAGPHQVDLRAPTAAASRVVSAKNVHARANPPNVPANVRPGPCAMAGPRTVVPVVSAPLRAAADLHGQEHAAQAPAREVRDLERDPMSVARTLSGLHDLLVRTVVVPARDALIAWLRSMVPSATLAAAPTVPANAGARRKKAWVTGASV